MPYDPNTGQDDGTGHFYDDPGVAAPITPEIVKGLYARFFPGYKFSDAEVTSHLGHPGGAQALTKFFEDQSKGYVPPAAGGTGGTGGGGGGGNGSAGDMLNPKIPPHVNLGGPPGIEYVPPTPEFTPPSYTPPPAFQLPTADQAANDPGYQFTFKQGMGALENSAAAKGVLNTGGTLKGLEDYGQAAASTQYQNVLNRMLQQYQTNYQTQYVDPYNMAFQNAAAKFAPQMVGYQTQAAAGQHQTDMDATMAFNTWLQQWNMKYGAATAQ